MLTGFSLDEEIWISLEEDQGDPKTEFQIRPIPAGKLDELRARSYDSTQRLRDAKTGEPQFTGADITASREFNREVVRWGIKAHRNGQGGLAVFESAETEYGGRKFSLPTDRVIEVYERTLITEVPVYAETSAPPAADGTHEPPTQKEIGKRKVSLLDVLANKVMAHQTISEAERRGLRGAGVAGA